MMMSVIKRTLLVAGIFCHLSLKAGEMGFSVIISISFKGICYNINKRWRGGIR